MADNDLVIIGSYCEANACGLTVYEFDSRNGDHKLLYSVPVANASFLTVSSDNIIYALTESDTESSLITSFRANRNGYDIIGTRNVGANSPCYIAITPDGRFIVTANYGDGTAAIFPICENGEAGECCMRIHFKGSGPFERRQSSSRAHCISFTPDNKFMLVTDLGGDSINGFRLIEGDEVPVKPTPDFVVRLVPGSGPRHIVFNKTGDIAYMINEISDTVTVLEYDGYRFNPIQYIAADNSMAHGAGDIKLSEDGSMLYASLRLKNDGIASFRIDSTNGKLTYLKHTPTGIHPRNIHITPDGKRMLVACRDSNCVEVYSIEGENLELINTISRERAVFVTTLPKDY